MKKILFSLSVFSIVALALTVVVPASANGWVVKNYNEAIVINEVGVIANTGENGTGHTDDDVEIVTGGAMAGAFVGNMVNTNDTLLWSDCGCDEGRTKVKNMNSAMVGNGVLVVANTGGNWTDHTDDDVTIRTGDALAAAEVTNVVNTNVTTIIRGGFDVGYEE